MPAAGDLRVAVIGAAGYVGGEALRLLLSHPAVGSVRAVSRSQPGRRLAELHPSLAHAPDLAFEAEAPEAIACAVAYVEDLAVRSEDFLCVGTVRMQTGRTLEFSNRDGLKAYRDALSSTSGRLRALRRAPLELPELRDRIRQLIAGVVAIQPSPPQVPANLEDKVQWERGRP